MLVSANRSKNKNLTRSFLINRYVAWNAHEPTQGHYVFEGMYDIEKFIKLAQAQDLLVIVRAGLYILVLRLIVALIN